MSDCTDRLRVPNWSFSVRLVYRCLRNHKKLAGPTNVDHGEARLVCEVEGGAEGGTTALSVGFLKRLRLRLWP
jgi:hypothetical protein